MNRRSFLGLLPLALTAPAIASISKCKKARAGYLTITAIDYKRGIITVDGSPGAIEASDMIFTNTPFKFHAGQVLAGQTSEDGWGFAGPEET